MRGYRTEYFYFTMIRALELNWNRITNRITTSTINIDMTINSIPPSTSHLPPRLLATIPPPESPWQVSVPPRPAQSCFSVNLTPVYNCEHDHRSDLGLILVMIFSKFLTDWSISGGAFIGSHNWNLCFPQPATSSGS